MVKQRIIRASTLVKGCQHQVFRIIYREALVVGLRAMKSERKYLLSIGD